jgi:hypothetical protein
LRSPSSSSRSVSQAWLRRFFSGRSVTPSDAFSLEQAAVLYVESLRIKAGFEAACIDQEPDGKPLPRGMLTCGEAVTLIPAVTYLVLLLHPTLADPDVLESAVRGAFALSAAGVAN